MGVLFLPFRCLDCNGRFFQLKWLVVRTLLVSVGNHLKTIKFKRLHFPAGLAVKVLPAGSSEDPPAEASS